MRKVTVLSIERLFMSELLSPVEKSCYKLALQTVYKTHAAFPAQGLQNDGLQVAQIRLLENSHSRAGKK